MISKPSVEWSKLYGQYEPRTAGDPETWVCVDDRPAHVQTERANRLANATGNTALMMARGRELDAYGNLYLQYQGGLIGFTATRAVAAEVLQPGSIASQAKPIDVLAGATAAHMLHQGVELGRHGTTPIDACGREKLHESVDDVVITQPERVYEYASAINADVTPGMVEQNGMARQRISQAGLGHSPSQVDMLLPTGWAETGNRLALPLATKYALEQTPHATGEFNINLGRAALFARAATVIGHPAYNLSYGRIGELNHTANSTEALGHVPDSAFLRAAAIDAGATAAVLEDATGMKFNFNVINA